MGKKRIKWMIDGEYRKLSKKYNIIFIIPI